MSSIYLLVNNPLSFSGNTFRIFGRLSSELVVCVLLGVEPDFAKVETGFFTNGEDFIFGNIGRGVFFDSATEDSS